MQAYITIEAENISRTSRSNATKAILKKFFPQQLPCINNDPELYEVAELQGESMMYMWGLCY